MPKDREACGRCGVSVTVDAVTDGEDSPDPYGEDRIEISERNARLASPTAWLETVTTRVNNAVRQLIWDR